MHEIATGLELVARRSERVGELLAAGIVPRVLVALAGDREVGWLIEAQNTWAFEYSPDWRQAQDTFALSPGLPLSTRVHPDEAAIRPVQWYFDNLLPEEELLKVWAWEAKLEPTDAFGLLRHYGGESAGSLVLQDPGAPPAAQGLKPLVWSELSRRIRNLPASSMTQHAPKRMLLAGAQHKMLVVLRQDDPDKGIFEPLQGTPSTHILKPDSPSSHYPSSAMNEYFTMRLARAMGLDVPNVHLLHVPEPVYLVQRFDRTAAANDDSVEREHIIDTCQLLNESRLVKYHSAHLETLALALDHCQSKMLARIQLFRWLVFNVLVGNGDNHLKNISFKVTAKGVELAPFYDLLCTGVYDAVVYAGADRAIWPRSDLCVAMGPVNKFAAVTVDSLLKAGEALGLTHQTAERELLAMRKDLAGKAQALAQGIQQEAAARVQGMPAGSDKEVALASMGAESQLLRAIQHIVIKEMLTRLWPAT